MSGLTSFTVCGFPSGATTGSGLSQLLNSRRQTETARSCDRRKTSVGRRTVEILVWRINIGLPEKASRMSNISKVDFGYRKPRTRSRQFNELVAAMRDDRNNGEALRRATNRDFRRLETEWKVVFKARDEAGMISNLKSRQQLSRRLYDIYEIQMLKIRGRLKVTKR